MRRDDLSTRATHQQTRAHNERLVLATVYDRGILSRADVARITGLTPATVSSNVTTLMGQGLMIEVGRGPSTGGKTPIMLKVPSDARHIIAIQFAESAFRGAVVDMQGEVVSSIEVATDDRDGEEALSYLLALIDSLIDSTDRPLIGIGIGAPGLSDTTTGTVVQSVTLNWVDLPLGPMLARKYGLPVYIANDCQASALAVHTFGHQRTQNLIVVSLGRGVGAGLILNGSLYQGDAHGAGEIGHTVVKDQGELCRCGHRGCLETVTSTGAILRRLSELVRFDGDPPSLQEAVNLFSAGDPLVWEVVMEGAQHVGSMLATLVGALNVDRIVLVGAATSFGEPWLQVITDTLRSRSLPRLAARTTVEIGNLGGLEVLLGASALLLTQELGLRLPATAVMPSGAQWEQQLGDWPPGGGLRATAAEDRDS